MELELKITCFQKENYTELKLLDWRVRVPWKLSFGDPGRPFNSYGVRLNPYNVIIEKPSQNRYLDLPWSWKIYGREVICKNGEWLSYSFSDRSKRKMKVQTLPYVYRLSNGKAQYRQAQVYVVRCKKKRLGLSWLPFYKLQRSIEVSFNKEVGDSAGSWKGGCVGCSYDMLPGETAEETLYRMQKERPFR